MTGFRPLHDQVLLKRVEAQGKTSGGLFIPEIAKEKPTEAYVVAVGPGKTLEQGIILPLNVKHGDKVVIKKWAGTEIKIEGVEHLIVKEDEILGIIKS